MKKVDLKRKVSVFYCDRCKKSFAESKALEVDNGDRSVGRGVTLPMPVLEDGQVSFKEKDICGNCVKKLCFWLKMK